MDSLIFPDHRVWCADAADCAYAVRGKGGWRRYLVCRNCQIYARPSVTCWLAMIGV